MGLIVVVWFFIFLFLGSLYVCMCFIFLYILFSLNDLILHLGFFVWFLECVKSTLLTLKTSLEISKSNSPPVLCLYWVLFILFFTGFLCICNLILLCFQFLLLLLFQFVFFLFFFFICVFG